MVRVGGWLVVAALLAAGGCAERSGRRRESSEPATAPRPPGGKQQDSPAGPKWDYSGWVWIHAKDDSYRFAVPPGSWNPLALTEKPMESTPEKPYRTGGFLNVQTPCGQYLIFQTSKESRDLSALSARAFLRGSLYGTLGAQKVSEGKVLPRRSGTAVQYIAKCRQDPFGIRSGEAFTAVVRVVHTGSNEYIFTISIPDTKYDEARTAQMLDSFRLHPARRSSQ